MATVVRGVGKTLYQLQHFSFATHVHELRAVYAAMAFHLYQCNSTTFNRAAMRILGHERLDVSLSYNAVALHDMPPAGAVASLGQIFPPSNPLS